MRQIIYVSTASRSVTAADAQAILTAARRNNARDAITGLLYLDGKRFLQALEGEDAAVASAYDRIVADPRHRAIVILSDRIIPEREFGDWSMAYRGPGSAIEDVLALVSTRVGNASAGVRATFESFAQIRRAA